MYFLEVAILSSPNSPPGSNYKMHIQTLQLKNKNPFLQQFLFMNQHLSDVNHFV